MKIYIFLSLFLLYHISSAFLSQSVIYDNFSLKIRNEDEKYLIIFYAVDKILLDIHNTHTNICSRAQTVVNLFVQFLRWDEKRPWWKIISRRIHKNVMNSSKCSLKRRNYFWGEFQLDDALKVYFGIFSLLA